MMGYMMSTNFVVSRIFAKRLCNAFLLFDVTTKYLGLQYLVYYFFKLTFWRRMRFFN